MTNQRLAGIELGLLYAAMLLGAASATSAAWHWHYGAFVMALAVPGGAFGGFSLMMAALTLAAASWQRHGGGHASSLPASSLPASSLPGSRR